LGNHELAIQDFAEAIELDQSCPTAILYMAKSKMKAGMIPSSIEDFKRSESMSSTPANLDGLGCCYHSIGEYDSAISAFT